jgi:hypothetical protein
MCDRYGGQCSAKKCRPARISEAEGKHYFRVTRIWYVRADDGLAAVEAAKSWDHDELIVNKLENVIPLEID